MSQFVIHADVVFPDEIVELLRLEVHKHPRALKVLHQRAIIDVRELLHQQLIKVLAGLLFAALVKEKKIFDVLRVDGLVGKELQDDHHGRKDQYCHGKESETIPAKELHEIFYSAASSESQSICVGGVVSEMGAARQGSHDYLAYAKIRG